MVDSVVVRFASKGLAEKTKGHEPVRKRQDGFEQVKAKDRTAMWPDTPWVYPQEVVSEARLGQWKSLTKRRSTACRVGLGLVIQAR